MRNNIML
ncbi:unnamed protein product [Acanthoscelides obtectus]|nr:unnamed protein product [Acanthoscelides obtectus]CAK1627433.1 hypothetical protein AOBTE_LOCUS4597 [Acanthoscelides obtectus]